MCDECGNEKTLQTYEDEPDIFKFCDYKVIEHCANQSKQQCDECEKGFFFDDTSCLSCEIDNCNRCELGYENILTQCIECEEEYYLTKAL